MKNRVIGFDGLRGAAAFTVLIAHISNVSDGRLARRGYFAVDLLFIISGYIISQAYDRRLASGLSVNDFMFKRIKRLYPEFCLGLVLGAIALIFRLGAMPGDIVPRTTPWMMLNFLFLPVLVPGFTFPLNAPGWSLFFQLIANTFHGLFGFKVRVHFICILIATSGIVFFTLILRYSPNMGWEWDPDHPAMFLGGFPRLGWAYGAGMLLYRVRERLPNLPLPLLLAVLAIVVNVPRAFGHVFDIACEIVVIPAIVAFATRASANDLVARMASFAGSLSYPLYAIHAALISVAFAYAQRNGIEKSQLYWGIVTVAILGAATIVMLLLERMRARMLRAPKAAPAVFKA